MFKFKGGETKQSIGEVQIPGQMARILVMIKTDIVDSGIPLLVSRNAMKEAKIKLDLKTEKATIFGKHAIAVNTTCGHYCIPLISSSDKYQSVWYQYERTKIVENK